jgi:hypothetical protein
MAALTANNGRITLSLAVAISARQIFQQASLRRRATNAWSHGSSTGAIATIVLPQNCAFAVLTAPVRRSGLSSRASVKAAAPFQRGVTASIGKWAN